MFILKKGNQCNYKSKIVDQYFYSDQRPSIMLNGNNVNLLTIYDIYWSIMLIYELNWRLNYIILNFIDPKLVNDTVAALRKCYTKKI